MVSTPTRKITKNFLIPPLSRPPELVFAFYQNSLDLYMAKCSCSHIPSGMEVLIDDFLDYIFIIRL